MAWSLLNRRGEERRTGRRHLPRSPERYNGRKYARIGVCPQIPLSAHLSRLRTRASRYRRDPDTGRRICELIVSLDQHYLEVARLSRTTRPNTSLGVRPDVNRAKRVVAISTCVEGTGAGRFCRAIAEE